LRKCKTCGERKAETQFRPVHAYLRRECNDCENKRREVYYRGNRELCIERSVTANRAWRNRSGANREKTRRWNRIAYRNRLLRRTATD